MSQKSGKDAEKREQRTELTPFGRAVHEQLAWLQQGYVGRPEDPMAVQLLAELRRGAGKLPEDVPEMLGQSYGLDGLWLEDDSRIRAAHVSLTLYSRHQQSLREHGLRMYRWHSPDSNRPSPVHTLGWAVRALMTDDEENGAETARENRERRQVRIRDSVRQRFIQAGKASNVKTTAERLRGLVDLLHNRQIPLDYARLAEDLYDVQQQGRRPEVRRRWNFAFNAYRKPNTAETNETLKNADKDAS
ncbi:type I-E CRISPR-associated protein Cse2/CasB [Marinactinospora rubrisoli]|uniref:Type I-E CRISPR-associated protein Cse2/CasB n=1 Tax=Marinactinospora rubrisoli TaxID=2715399 RepID=A0ABW2KBF5_9ACTN